MRNGTALKLVVAAALGLVAAVSRQADADIYEDHLYSWGGGLQGLQQGLIGTESVSGQAVKACGGEFSVSTGAAVSRWNAALGRTVFQASCTSPQAFVTTDDFDNPQPGVGCDSWAHCCTATTLPEQVLNGEELHNPMYVRMNPAMFPGQGDYADGGTHTSRDITHELGHVLGHADYDFGQYGPCQFGTIMDKWERCYPSIVAPQPQDVTNYNDAYRPNAPANVGGSSPAPGLQPGWTPVPRCPEPTPTPTPGGPTTPGQVWPQPWPCIPFDQPTPSGTPPPPPVTRPPEPTPCQNCIDLGKPVPYELPMEVAGKTIHLPAGSTYHTMTVHYPMGTAGPAPTLLDIIERGDSKVVIDADTGRIVRWNVAPADEADFRSLILEPLEALQ